MKKKINTCDAHVFVNRLEPFMCNGGTLYGRDIKYYAEPSGRARRCIDDDEVPHYPWEQVGHQYVVYSYGPHWPLFIYCHDNGRWYANEDQNSRTTNRHRKCARPSAHTERRLPDDMITIARDGLGAFIAAKFKRAA